MNYQSYIPRLLDLFHLTLVAHWLNRGASDIDTHKTLDDLYKEIILFIDELSEITLSISDSPELKEPLSFETIKVENYKTSLSDLIKGLRELRRDLSEAESDPIYDDWRSRLISALNHYIFMLDAPNKSIKTFSNKNEDPIVAEIRKLFKDQNEFVTRFNAYIKGKEDPDPKVQEFFKKEEETLIRVSDAILTMNAKLFDLRKFLEFDDNHDDKIKYNELVNFFDLFVS